MNNKRLTQRVENGVSLILNDPKDENEARQQLIDKFKEACAKLADYEDKEEQGLLSKHKYALNQEVYYISEDIEKGEVLTIYFDGTFNNIPKYEIEYNGNIWAEDEVFLTKEAAEQALKEQNGNQ